LLKIESVFLFVINLLMQSKSAISIVVSTLFSAT